MKELQVSAIEEGTVIDHLPPASVWRIADILRLSDNEDIVLMAMNLKSSKQGRKGVIKLSHTYLSETAINAIALLAEGAHISTIKNYEVVKKIKIGMPENIVGIVKCYNPLCISNKDEMAVSKFKVMSKEPLQLKCLYCEKTTGRDTLRFIEQN